MTSQRPTRFENYPLEPDPGASIRDASPESAPRPLAPTPPVVPPRGSQWSRRSIIAAAIGLSVAGAAGLVRFDAGRSHQENSADETAEMGDYSTTVADNWAVMSEDDAQMILGNGSNRLYAWADSLPVGSLAMDALEPMVKRAVPDIEGLKTSVGAPVDASDSEVQRASLAGAGTLGQRSAQMISNIWIGADGQYLFTIRILTDKVNSDAAYGAQQMIDQLSEDF